jgi:hypothetical protein
LHPWDVDRLSVAELDRYVEAAREIDRESSRSR